MTLRKLKLAIPRLDCLGLIEARSAGIWSRAFFAIPRLDCLGLIEASVVMQAVAGAADGIPRLDCLGLIEALPPTSTSRSTSTDSEA